MIEPGATPKALWAGRGEAYDRWADAQAAFAEGFNGPLLDAAGISADAKVIDVASGAGEPALSAARRVGAAGHVLASDLAPLMLAGAVRRARTQNQPNISFVVADMTCLPLADATFDALTCRFGLMFVPDVARALEESRRVLRSGGHAAFLVWGPMSDNTLSSVIAAALDDIMGRSAGDLERLPFRLAEPGLLAGLLRQAGFQAAREIEMKSQRAMPVGEPFWLPTMDKCLGADWRRDDVCLAAVNAAIERRLAAVQRGGSYELRNHVRIAVGLA